MPVYNIGNKGSGGALASYEKQYRDAFAANEKRYQEGLTLLDQSIARYQPGGQFGQGAMAQYEQGKTQALATGTQSMVNSGLSNTTVAAALPLAYEQEVGTPFRLQLEDMRMQNLTQAEMAKTGFIERRTDSYPDPNMMAQLQMQASSGGGVSYQKSNFLDTWGAPDPGVSARNQTDKIQKEMAYQQQMERNQSADAARRNMTSGTQTQTKGTTPSMSEIDYASILAKNMGLISPPNDMTTRSGQTYINSIWGPQGGTAPTSTPSTKKPQPFDYGLPAQYGF